MITACAVQRHETCPDKTAWTSISPVSSANATAFYVHKLKSEMDASLAAGVSFV